MLNKVAPNQRTLSNYLQWTKRCYFTLRRIVKPPEYNEITFTTYILQKEQTGPILAMLIDKNGNSTHAIGIYLDKGLIYDCKGKCVMELSINDLSVCCGQNMVFDCFSKVGELWNTNGKPHG